MLVMQKIVTFTKNISEIGENPLEIKDELKPYFKDRYSIQQISTSVISKHDSSPVLAVTVLLTRLV